MNNRESRRADAAFISSTYEEISRDVSQDPSRYQDQNSPQNRITPGR